MDGASFLTYVKRILKRTDKDTEIYEAIADVIADIRLQLRTEDYKEEAFVTLGVSPLGDYRIALPNDFKHIIGDLRLVDDSSGHTRVLKKISKQTYDELYSDRLHASTANVDLAMPVHFCIYAEQIFLGPVPDSTSYIYHINYTTEDYAAITSVTDPVPFSDRYRSMLRAGVLAEVFMGLEAFDEADYWKQVYLDGLLKLKINDDRNTSDTEGVVYHGI
jgi:hypothetical protein